MFPLTRDHSWCMNSPPIIIQLHFILFVHHQDRLDCKSHSRFHHHIFQIFLFVMTNQRRHMQLPSNPMARKLFIDPIPVSMCILLNFVTNIFNPFSRPTNGYGLKHGLSSDLTESSNILMHIAYHDHSRIICMKPIFITNYVYIQIISILKHV